MDACWEDAVRRGDAVIMRNLLSRGIDPNARDRHGQTELPGAPMPRSVRSAPAPAR